MYSSFHSTSQSVAQSIRSDIFSLLGNSGKTIFSPAAREFSFSFRFLFSQSLHKAVDMIEQIAYRKPLTYIAISLATLMISPSETSFAAEPITVGMERTFIITAYYSPMV
jgi:hypothetical protein